LHIEASGQAAIGVYEGGKMLKKDYKAHVTANRFDLSTLPVCGAKTRSGSLYKHKGNLRNGRCKRHGGASTGPAYQTFGKSPHRYVHSLRTKEVIAMRKLVTEMNESLNDLLQQV
jgi:hypothetical protein